MGSPHRPVWADPALVAEDRSIDEVESVRNWATLPPRRAWSTLGPHPIGTERYAAVTSGTAFAQVVVVTLGRQDRVQNPDKDELRAVHRRRELSGRGGISGRRQPSPLLGFDRLRRGKHLLRDEKLARLSPQEGRILARVADGRTNGQIGQELGLARNGQGLRLQHPVRTRGRPAGRGRRLPSPTHHPARQRPTIAQAGKRGSSACTALG
jgi:hypothetical protein